MVARDFPYDLVVVGGGLGGLATAALAQARGVRTALLDAHTKLGGCAGYFDRGPYVFDAGATALMGLGPDEPIGALLGLLGVDFAGEPTTAYRVHLPDRSLDIVADAAAFEEASACAFPERIRSQKVFWRLQAWVGEQLFAAAGRVPRMPVRSPGDFLHDLQVLGFTGLVAAAMSTCTVQDVLRCLNLNGYKAFRSLIAMLLQDTAQAGPETVPFANAAACLQAYRRGMSRPRGGMRALAEGLGSRFAEQGGDLRRATLVDGVEPVDGGFVVVTRRRERLRTRQVAFNLPLDLAAGLLKRPIDGRLAAAERRSRAVWSALTGYVAIRREAVPDDTPLFHQVLQDDRRPIHDGNNVLISLSPVDDEGYGPPEVRIATMSTHVRPEDWLGLDRTSHQERKALYSERLLAALGRALPDAPSALVHQEFGTPKSFLRYTRRRRGAVGGPPVSRRNANLRAVGSDVLGPGIWVVGDSVFPGQGTMAVVLGAIRVVERITGESWVQMRTRQPTLARPVFSELVDIVR